LFTVPSASAASSAPVASACASAWAVTSFAPSSCRRNHQNISPPSRAASARALTRPWNW
jgi:hypothetical protein